MASIHQSELTPRHDDWSRLNLVNSEGQSEFYRLVPALQPTCELLAARPEVNEKCETYDQCSCEADWLKTLTIKVQKAGINGGTPLMIGGVDLKGKVTWVDSTLNALGWDKEELELSMRK